jgi:hypothetical protein
MKISGNAAVLILITSFVLFFVVALTQHDYPMMIIGGEQSPGTWISGALLLFCSALSLTLSFKKAIPWIFIFFFFIALAIDERFMLHEQIKESIVFSTPSDTSRFLYELPVIIGACTGFGIALTLMRELKHNERILLSAAIVLGTISVVVDIFSLGVLWEECTKLIAELIIAVALIKKVTQYE